MVNALNTVKLVKNILINANIEDAALETRWLFRFVYKKEYLLLDKNEEMPDELADSLIALAQKRAEHYPLQYILGEWEFMGQNLKIGEGVLIPRADTETVVERAVNCLQSIKCPKILDLCSGSGAISVGIKTLLPSAELTAVELYDEAFYYLKQNCENIANCVQKDALFFYKEIKDDYYDLIISNPPYISKKEMQALQPEVYYEPANALTDNADGLCFYKAFSLNYKNKIKKNGFIVYEIGYLQKDDVCTILRNNGYKNINAYKDSSQNYRAITAQR